MMRQRAMILRACASGLAVICGLLAGQAHAADFKSVGADAAILYDAPTNRGRKLFIAPRGMPLEIVLMQGDWARVRDSTGELSWIEKRTLSDKRMLVTLAPVGLRGAADDNAPVVLRLDGAVLVELADAPQNGWVSVRHRDGAAGWLKVGEVWGL